MRLLVIQEQHFMKLSNGEVWVDKQSDCKFWDRYLNVFDEVIVCARIKNIDNVGVKALRSDRARVSFIGLPDFRGAAAIFKHYFEIQRVLHNALEQVDCVIFRAPSPISMVSYGIVRRSKKPFAVELMNNPKTHFSPQSMHHFYQPVIQYFITNQTKRMCRSANGVSYVTENTLQTLYPSTARLHGTTERNFEASYSTINLEKKDYVKRDWPEERPNPIILVHSGEMLDYRKGQDIFIDTISILIKNGYNVKGILIGDGEIRDEFEKKAKTLEVWDNVEFVGWKSGFSKVQEQLHRGHFFVFPSTGEGLPRSVIEAMASGLVCIGSNIDGVKELLPPILLVNSFEGNAFARTIQNLLENWEDTIVLQGKLYDKSLNYINTRLVGKRSKFYKQLSDCAQKML